MRDRHNTTRGLALYCVPGLWLWTLRHKLRYRVYSNKIQIQLMQGNYANAQAVIDGALLLFVVENRHRNLAVLNLERTYKLSIANVCVVLVKKSSAITCAFLKTAAQQLFHAKIM